MQIRGGFKLHVGDKGVLPRLARSAFRSAKKSLCMLPPVCAEDDAVKNGVAMHVSAIMSRATASLFDAAFMVKSGVAC